MGDGTAISWTNRTWNPVHGCSKVSPGCDHCYAETLSLRRGFTELPWEPANAQTNVQLKPHKLREPLRWRDPAMVFVNSMSDLFHDQVPDTYVAKVFAAMAATPRHTYQVLTKRPGRMASLLGSPAFPEAVARELTDLGHKVAGGLFGAPDWPLPNVWMGVSVENDRWAGVRIPRLLATPAAVRFLSVEPMLGPVDLRPYLDAGGLGWVIVGGESGPHLIGAGPGHPRWMQQAWARDVRDVCVAHGVAYFYKQDSGPRTELRPWLVEPDGRRFTWHQYPGDLTPPVEVMA